MASVDFEHVSKRFDNVDQQIVAQMDTRRIVRPGDEIRLFFDMDHGHLFVPRDGRAITSGPRDASLGSTEHVYGAATLGVYEIPPAPAN